MNEYKNILKVTGIIGSSQAVIIFIRIIRGKIVAVLLGPIGVGILGIYQSTITLIRTATGFGINASALRDLGKAARSDNQIELSTIILTIRRLAILTGILGSLIMLSFSPFISRIAFGNDDYIIGISIASISIILLSVSESQIALLQGLRKIKLLAKANIYGAILGLIFSIPLYWKWGINGIVPALILSNVLSLYRSWWFARKVVITKIKLSNREIFENGMGMLKLGFFMVITSFSSNVTFYIVRLIVSNKLNLESVGYYQAAFTLSNVYLMTFVNSMLTDYLPSVSLLRI